MNNKSKIGLGMAAIGRPSYINIRATKPSEFDLATFRHKGIDLLDNAYDHGVRYYDTAPGYGIAEQMLADWIIKKNDSSIEVATKWGYTYVANFDPNATQHEVKEHSLKKLDEQWEKSKTMLPRLTTYQIHSATFETGVLENEAILHRLAELRNDHNLLMGITTTGANQMVVLRNALDIQIDGRELFDVFQVTYNIFDQSLASLANEVSSQGKRLVIKEALANGRVFPNKEYPNYSSAYSLLIQLAAKYSVGIDAIALRFCMDSIPVFKVLSGADVAHHLADNLRANDFQLENEDIESMRKLAVKPDQYWDERKKLDWN
ncbi:MAG: aldo/keto reductase [Saprospiraceae bacterium]|nr:aldo/keto reductase [Saprospiraceae bacterium]